MKNTPKNINNGQFTTWLFYIIAAIAVIGAGYTFFITGIPVQATTYSALILEPGSYSNYADSNTTSFSFTLKNTEGADAVYNIRYLANSIELGSEQATIPKDEQKSLSKSFDFGNGFAYPVKIEVWAETNGKTYSIFYWLKENG